MQLSLLVGDIKERELSFFLEGRRNELGILNYMDELVVRRECYGFTAMDTWDINNQDYYWPDDDDEEYDRYRNSIITEQLHFEELWGTQHLGNNIMRSAFMEAGYASRY